ncbi:MAG: LolA family protein [Blastocatellia bacterium]
MTIRRFVFLSLLIVFAGQIASAQSVEELVPKLVAAIGGADRIKAIKTQRITAKISFGPNNDGTILVEFKTPNMIREQITFQGTEVVRGYDGKSGWQINPFSGSSEPLALSPEDAKYIAEEAELEGPVIGYKEEGNKLELQGKQQVTGNDAFKIKVTLKNGDVNYYYYDCKTYLKVKWEATRQDQGQDLTLESYFSDYHAVEGLMYPFKIKSDTQNKEGGQEITTQKIEINVPMDDSKFKLPAGNQSGSSSVPR